MLPKTIKFDKQKAVQEVIKNAKAMLGSTLVTPQTGPNGRKVLRLYIEETCEVKKEFYLSCLIDRTSSKIAFISSASGGMNIEEVAKKEPQKITTVKITKNVPQIVLQKSLRRSRLAICLSTSISR